MLKRILSLTLCTLMLIPFAGCKKKEYTLSVDTSASTPSVVEPEPETYINPLTGEKNLSKDDALLRPVAIMVNNISVAQPLFCVNTKTALPRQRNDRHSAVRHHRLLTIVSHGL